MASIQFNARHGISVGISFSISDDLGNLSGNSLSLLTPISVGSGGLGVQTITGIIKGNGISPVSAAIAGTDYATPNQTMFIGTTSFAINRSSAAIALTGISSIDGSAATLTTARTINGVSFNGSSNITITSNTTSLLTRGSFLTGSNFDGSTPTTWSVDAFSTNNVSTIVARDLNGDFAGRNISASVFETSLAQASALTDTIFYSSTDTFIRKNNATGFRASLNVPTRTGGDASGSWNINSATTTHTPNRTDVTPYPVLWGTGTSSQLSSCAAITIQSSTGTLTATKFVGDGSSLTGIVGGSGVSNITLTTVDVSAVVSNMYILTGGTASAVTLPVGVLKDYIIIADRSGRINNVILTSGGQLIEGLPAPMYINIANSVIKLLYTGSTLGWIVL